MVIVSMGVCLKHSLCLWKFAWNTALLLQVKGKYDTEMRFCAE